MIEQIAIWIMALLCLFGACSIMAFYSLRQSFRPMHEKYGWPLFIVPKEAYWLFFGNGLVLALKFLSTIGVL